MSAMTSTDSDHLVDEPTPISVSCVRPRDPWVSPRALEDSARNPTDARQESNGTAPLSEDLLPPRPVHKGKVQRPTVREDVLSRPRLLELLESKLGCRVVLVIADAGYGKTTLLADFSRRARARTMWYRADEEDRDWPSVVRHLIAAGHSLDASFGTLTSSRLACQDDTVSLDDVVDDLVHELHAVVKSPTVLVLDDFHLLDTDVNCREVVRRIISEGPQGLSVVIASRRTPSLRLGRLRAANAVSEITTDDLRFNLNETTELFDQNDGIGADADLVNTLQDRTEGWVASLHLVRTAVRDRSSSEARSLVENLHGGSRALHDYVAEVVVGDLSDELQHFLMTTALLQVVTPRLAAVASGRSEVDTAYLISSVEHLALLTRLSDRAEPELRYHPLVREFLEARLLATHGVDLVSSIHRTIGRALRSKDWATAAHHFRQGGDSAAMVSTVMAAIPTIMGRAQYSVAESFLRDVRDSQAQASSNLILGRIGMQQGDFDGATRRAQAVLDGSADAVQRDHALMNLLAVDFNYGNGDRALTMASRLRDVTDDGNLRSIADATIRILTLTEERQLDSLSHHLQTMAASQRADSPHHFGVTMFNLAEIAIAQDRMLDARDVLDEALLAFTETASTVERQAAAILRIGVDLRLGESEKATEAMRRLLDADVTMQNDSLLEAADAFDTYASSQIASMIRDRLDDSSTFTLADQRLAARVFARHELRRGQSGAAQVALEKYPDGLATSVGMAEWHEVDSAHVALARGSEEALGLLSSAARRAGQAGIHGARRFADVLLASSLGEEHVVAALETIGNGYQWHITAAANELVAYLSVPRIWSIVEGAVHAHPDRWRPVLRARVAVLGSKDVGSARLLEQIGERSDLVLLRKFAKANGRQQSAAGLGKALAIQLATPVFVEDLGRVVIKAGPRTIDGATVRRKVLALLCFLLSRSGLAATKDQVLDALWPELTPNAGGNSLNQTLYFLRRLLDSEYEEDVTATFVHHQGDLLWLDSKLVACRSMEFRHHVRAIDGVPSPDDTTAILEQYRGHFALDFEYEEWAAEYREILHAAFLNIVERSISEDTAAAHVDRAIATARRALDADPRNDQMERSLIRLLRTAGAQLAASEQYAHYASIYREDLGVEPPSLDSL